MGFASVNANRAIEIRCDGNSVIGYGHIRRCITLKNELEKHGFRVNLLPLSKDTSHILNNQESTGDIPGLVIFDSPINLDPYLQNQKKNGTLTVTLDYFGAVYPDINIVIFPHRPYGATKKSYIGFEYVMIREEIINAKVLYQNSPVIGNEFILVVIGGGDILGQGPIISEYLSRLGFRVILVCGPASSSLKNKIKDSFETLINPPNLPELMATALWVITNGGGTMFEAIYFKRNVYALPQTKEETRIVEYFFEKKVISGYGFSDYQKFNFRERIQSSYDDQIDDLGATRISKIISDFLM